MRNPRNDTLARAFQIIEAVADLGMGTTAQELAAHLDVPASTIYRMLNTLVADEYLVRTADLRGFALGARLEGMLAAATTPRVSATARDAIDDCRGSVRFGVHIMTFRPTSLRVADVDPDHPLPNPQGLMRYPHASAPGKLLLASLSRWREVLPGRPVSVTPKTIVDVGRISAQIDYARSSGTAIEAEELELGWAGIAVPIHDCEGSVRGAVSLTGMASRLDAMADNRQVATDLATRLGPLLF
ncbi:IclR family transcriptional regulator [Gordonia jinhuaensis]|uniref:Transcriptional regulator n=1 Tax=Gordonia jinhuaensis TaxID=1517702 RepID=A0A916THQ7_9ACTN|nr:IclR family transcriptional regulator C-terminal domain-containing protein [Gordonia jinhuaensis]GGB45999.1 transcriptional regulator [Gordonia jinhuaensis]